MGNDDRAACIAAVMDALRNGSFGGEPNTVTICQGPPACDLIGDAAVAAQESGCVWCTRIEVWPDGEETVKGPRHD